MSKPTSYFPATALPSYQELGKHLDTLGAYTQKSDVALVASYAASGAITLTGAAAAFATWPTYGFIENQTEAGHEIMLYYANTGTALSVKATGRGLDGTSAAASSGSTDSIRFIEARVLGLTINQILAEIAAIENSLNLNMDFTESGSPHTVLAANSGKFHTNAGTSTIPTLNLPAMTSKLRYPIISCHSSGIKLVANGSDTIRINADVTAAGGYIKTTEIGSSILLVGTAVANLWIGAFKTGTWTLDA